MATISKEKNSDPNTECTIAVCDTNCVRQRQEEWVGKSCHQDTIKFWILEPPPN